MKVRLEEKHRSLYTLEELDMAKAVIKAEKEDEMSAKDWAEYAAKEALRGEVESLVEVLKAEAKTAKNCRIKWDRFCEGSGNMDVWVSFLAETTKGFIRGGAYLSDIWETGATEYKQHMYVRRAEWLS